MENSVALHWEMACEKARRMRGLDATKRDVLALIYTLIAVEDGCAADAISDEAVRYRLADPARLHEALSALLPGPLDQVPVTAEDGKRQLIRSRLDGLVDERGQFTGPPHLEESFRDHIEAIVEDRKPFSAPAPLEGRIWRRWAALQAPVDGSYNLELFAQERRARRAVMCEGSGLT